MTHEHPVLFTLGLILIFVVFHVFIATHVRANEQFDARFMHAYQLAGDTDSSFYAAVPNTDRE